MWPGCRCRQSPDDDDSCECRVSSGILPTPAAASVNTLTVVWCRQVASPGVHLNTPGLLQLTTLRDQRQPVLTQATSRSKRRSTPHHQHEKVRAHHSRPAAATLASSPLTCVIKDHRAGVQGATRSPACVSGGRLPTCVCHWTLTTAFVGHRHVPSAANQHTSWRSFIRCCWTTRMEQSANPTARVGHYTRKISTCTQSGHWQLQRRVTVFFVHCVQIYLFTYLLTLFPLYRECERPTAVWLEVEVQESTVRCSQCDNVGGPTRWRHYHLSYSLITVAHLWAALTPDFFEDWCLRNVKLPIRQ